MDKAVSEIPVENFIVKLNTNIAQPLALCGNPSKCWTPNTTKHGRDPRDGRLIITVAILNSTSQDRDDFVRETASMWALHANIKFRFVSSSEPSDIRILYSDKSRSYIGVKALDGGRNEATMWLNYIDGDKKYNRHIILHEFGHALGFEHEHSSPEAGIQWNRTAVIARYRTNSFTIHDIDRNIFWVAHDASIRSCYDSESIMSYQMSQDLVTSGIVSDKMATGLSPHDKEWAKEFYPFVIHEVRLKNRTLMSQNETEGSRPWVREYQDHLMHRVNKQLDDCFLESGMKVFRCNRPNCRPKNRQCDACLERLETFQNEGMSMMSQPSFWISAYVGSL
ncbi:uncharacterized protein GGS22DRAFT_194897 [Annulohypoxylon maeteangense]|uniref:uncharacterized protein n=1 Tax=Annulohypoxylon maeteangense TaxID=1927788 RepID=UPI0020083748|nr:uncharacterized protein GGS22DRAFT_194897 [Annulohypoxylon maeteangense]KAI0884412.1 hypothetical protein GGS22DRAFT_194897 [Annulohypoxylon maeteangense]